jgi:hypothetical protein
LHQLTLETAQDIPWGDLYWYGAQGAFEGIAASVLRYFETRRLGGGTSYSCSMRRWSQEEFVMYSKKVAACYTAK